MEGIGTNTRHVARKVIVGIRLMNKLTVRHLIGRSHLHPLHHHLHGCGGYADLPKNGGVVAKQPTAAGADHRYFYPFLRFRRFLRVCLRFLGVLFT